jgi:Cdc6-like AAA superfamily ATPase
MTALKKTRKTLDYAQTVRDEALDLPRQLPAGLPLEALDDRIAIVGKSGSGKTYTAKGFIERLLSAGARVAVINPLGVWWGPRAPVSAVRHRFIASC